MTPREVPAGVLAALERLDDAARLAGTHDQPTAHVSTEDLALALAWIARVIMEPSEPPPPRQTVKQKKRRVLLPMGVKDPDSDEQEWVEQQVNGRTIRFRHARKLPPGPLIIAPGVNLRWDNRGEPNRDDLYGASVR